MTTAWRATDSVNINANYTWSHCIGNATNGSAVPNPGQNYVHHDNRALDSGECAQDRRHLFNLTVLARTPKFSGRALSLVASGWLLVGVLRQAYIAIGVGSGSARAITFPRSYPRFRIRIAPAAIRVFRKYRATPSLLT